MAGWSREAKGKLSVSADFLARVIRVGEVVTGRRVSHVAAELQAMAKMGLCLMNLCVRDQCLKPGNPDYFFYVRYPKGEAITSGWTMGELVANLTRPLAQNRSLKKINFNYDGESLGMIGREEFNELKQYLRDRKLVRGRAEMYYAFYLMGAALVTEIIEPAVAMGVDLRWPLELAWGRGERIVGQPAINFCEELSRWSCWS